MTGRRRIVKLAREAKDCMVPAVRDYQSKVLAQPEVSCTSCTTFGCCKQVALCTTFEAVLLASYLHDQNVELLRACCVRGAEDRRGWERAWHNPAELQRHIASEFERDRLCVLHNGRKCLAYQLRPTTCSTYYVITAPHLCEPPGNKRVGATDGSKLLSLAMITDAGFVDLVGGDDRWVPRPLPIAAAVARAVELLELEP